MCYSTCSHRITIVRKYLRHHVKEIVVVLVEDDGFQSDLAKKWLETLREFAFNRPVFFGNRALEFIKRGFEVRMKRLLGSHRQ